MSEGFVQTLTALLNQQIVVVCTKQLELALDSCNSFHCSGWPQFGKKFIVVPYFSPLGGEAFVFHGTFNLVKIIFYSSPDRHLRTMQVPSCEISLPTMACAVRCHNENNGRGILEHIYLFGVVGFGVYVP